MNRSHITTPAAVVLATLVALSSGLPGGSPAFAAAAATAKSPPADQLRESVLVTGTGVVFGVPDTLTANFAVEATAATVAEAMDRATAAAVKVRDALVTAGMTKADLQTSNVDVNPKRSEAGEITGYVVGQGLTATIRDLPRAGALLSAAVAAGGDAARLNGVSFTVEDDTALLAEARRKAFADARAKAELYAREAGRKLGQVVKVSEVTPGYSQPYEQDRMSLKSAAVPIEPGRQRLDATVTVEWALGAAR